MRIAIAGCGGVGGLLGALLARSGTEVVWLARGTTLEALRKRGLVVQTPGEKLELKVVASDDPKALGPCDALLVTVKTWQLAGLAPTLAPLLGPGAVAVPLENGVESADLLAQSLGAARVAGGLCHLFSQVVEPGVIKLSGPRPGVTVGELAPGTRGRLDALCTALRAGGITATVAPDIRAALWEKLLFVGPFGAVGAVARAGAGTLRGTPETWRLLQRAMEEAAQTARAQGIGVAADAVPRALERVQSLPVDATTSMQRDLVSGRPSELQELIGAIVRAAARAGVAAPANEFLLAALLPQELAARARSKEG